MTERELATEVVTKLQAAGYTALWAGGCVRDELLGLTPADYDIATSATPEQVQKLFRRCHSFGASFGVVEVLGPRDEHGDWLKVQVATFRTDGSYTDGRRPDTVQYSSPEEDAARRDFTINGLFFDPVTQKVMDYVGGKADLEARVLRAIGDPVARFTEDKLRVLRAVRMAARFSLTIEEQTWQAVVRMADQIRVVSVERIAEELRKMLVHPSRGRGMTLLRESGLLKLILLEAGELPEKLASPEVKMVAFELVLAALLQDCEPKIVGHVAKRLKLSNQEADDVIWLVSVQQLLVRNPTPPRSTLFPILADERGILLVLFLVLCGNTAAGEFARKAKNQHTLAELNPPPLLTGDDLKALGYKPGPQFKAWLDELRRKQLDGELTSRADAEEWMKEQRRG
jgi:poly(A) polymerase